MPLLRIRGAEGVFDHSSENDQEYDGGHDDGDPDEHPYETPEQRVHLRALRVRAVLVIIHDHRYDDPDDAQDQSQEERSERLGLLGDRSSVAGGLCRAYIHAACRAERTPFRAFLTAIRAIHILRMPLSID